MVPFIVILGPTASGKTALSIELAKRLNAEIVSADAIQVYRKLDIGSAKPTMAERGGIPHHMLDIVMPDEVYSVQRFQQDASKCIEDIGARNCMPLVVGGTGLYIHSLTYDMDFHATDRDPGYRAELQDMLTRQGSLALHSMLRDKDPARAQKLHPNDSKRIIRALEILRHSTAKEYDFRRALQGLSVKLIGLKWDRAKLYKRIDARVDAMMEAGLLLEVEGLLSQGYDPDLPSMQGLGYKQLIGYIQGRFSLYEAIDDIKRQTRRFAKRQETWFKRDERVQWYEIDENMLLDELSLRIMEYMELYD